MPLNRCGGRSALGFFAKMREKRVLTRHPSSPRGGQGPYDPKYLCLDRYYQRPLALALAVGRGRVQPPPPPHPHPHAPPTPSGIGFSDVGFATNMRRFNRRRHTVPRMILRVASVTSVLDDSGLPWTLGHAPGGAHGDTPGPPDTPAGALRGYPRTLGYAPAGTPGPSVA
jgi:hypothetical protein